MNEKIKKLNDIIKIHNQFKRSQLWTDISVVLKCLIEKAEELAHTHCNMISFWAILKAYGYIDNHYRDFFEYCLENDFCKQNGYINVDKDVITGSFGITDISFLRYDDYENIINPEAVLNPEKFYQVKIKGNTSGFHFLSGYVQDNIFKISDTSYRGIGVPALDHITDKNFKWITEV